MSIGLPSGLEKKCALLFSIHLLTGTNVGIILARATDSFLMCCCCWVYLSYLSKYSSSDLCDAGSNDRIIYVLFMHHPLTGSDNTFFVCGICFSTTCQLKKVFIFSPQEKYLVEEDFRFLSKIILFVDMIIAPLTQLHDWLAKQQ